jgi:hypothetical protein
MLDWIKRRGSTPYQEREANAETAKPQGRFMSGKYLLLYKYLENGYGSNPEHVI